MRPRAGGGAVHSCERNCRKDRQDVFLPIREAQADGKYCSDEVKKRLRFLAPNAVDQDDADRQATSLARVRYDDVLEVEGETITLLRDARGCLNHLAETQNACSHVRDPAKCGSGPCGRVDELADRCGACCHVGQLRFLCELLVLGEQVGQEQCDAIVSQAPTNPSEHHENQWPPQFAARAQIHRANLLQHFRHGERRVAHGASVALGNAIKDLCSLLFPALCDQPMRRLRHEEEAGRGRYKCGKGTNNGEGSPTHGAKQKLRAHVRVQGSECKPVEGRHRQWATVVRRQQLRKDIESHHAAGATESHHQTTRDQLPGAIASRGEEAED
mmetsp:Transcript_50118/g.126331  ORF Transcript_50118/g.126331 Transcript_50118/m.126331 type:complete len:329 (+) Transcript_50118:408-1394(+)